MNTKVSLRMSANDRLNRHENMTTIRRQLEATISDMAYSGFNPICVNQRLPAIALATAGPSAV